MGPMMLWFINNFPFFNRCLVWDGLSILIGTKGGDLLVFDLVGFRVEHRYKDHRSNPITCIAASISSTNELIILTGSEDGRLSVWESEVVA